jgi:hypothetical protein
MYEEERARRTDGSPHRRTAPPGRRSLTSGLAPRPPEVRAETDARIAGAAPPQPQDEARQRADLDAALGVVDTTPVVKKPVKAQLCMDASVDLELVQRALADLAAARDADPPDTATASEIEDFIRDMVELIAASLDEYIANGCCEPNLETFEDAVRALPWPKDGSLDDARKALIDAIEEGQRRARKDHEHCRLDEPGDAAGEPA